jgi:hypothetical protein
MGSIYCHRLADYKKKDGPAQETGCEEMDLSHLLAIRLAPGCCEQRNESLALIIVSHRKVVPFPSSGERLM